MEAEPNIELSRTWLSTLLTDCAQLIQPWMEDLKRDGGWSAWDQSVRDRITEALVAIEHGFYEPPPNAAQSTPCNVRHTVYWGHWCFAHNRRAYMAQDGKLYCNPDQPAPSPQGDAGDDDEPHPGGPGFWPSPSIAGDVERVKEQEREIKTIGVDNYWCKRYRAAQARCEELERLLERADPPYGLTIPERETWQADRRAALTGRAS